MDMLKDDLIKMIDLQERVNKEIGLKLEKQPEVDDYVVAYNVELYEFINAVGIWKWWKHSATINKERILDELADCYAFFLSALGTLPEKRTEKDKDGKETVVMPRYNVFDEVIDIFNQILDTKDEEFSNFDRVKVLIKIIATAEELQKPITTTTSFAIANAIAYYAIDGLQWSDIVNAYDRKSNVNIERQKENY